MKRVVLISLLGAAAVALLVVGLMRGRGKTTPVVAQAVDRQDAGFTIFGVNQWLDSCLGGCRKNAQRRLAHLSTEKQRQFCDVNCECGMQKMTEPGPRSDQVKAPSAAWLRLTEAQQMEAAQECQKRSSDSVGGVQPPGAASP